MHPFSLNGANSLLYKFYSCGTIDALKERTLAFTPPKYFNDPFELLPKIVSDSRAHRMRQSFGTFTNKQKEAYRRGYNLEFGAALTKSEFNRLVKQHKNEIAVQAPKGLEGFSRDIAKRLVEIVSKDFGIACLSKSWNHPLMWGHYSGGFTGFCVGYEMPLCTDFGGMSRVEVEYSTERYPLSEAHILAGEILREDVDGIIRTKSVHWAYEKEVRFVMDISSPALTPKPDRSQFYLEHPCEAVREIIIGMRCGEEDRKVLRDLRNKRYSHSELFDTVADDSSFEVTRYILD